MCQPNLNDGLLVSISPILPHFTNLSFSATAGLEGSLTPGIRRDFRVLSFVYLSTFTLPSSLLLSFLFSHFWCVLGSHPFLSSTFSFLCAGLTHPSPWAKVPLVEGWITPPKSFIMRASKVVGCLAWATALLGQAPCALAYRPGLWASFRQTVGKVKPGDDDGTHLRAQNVAARAWSDPPYGYGPPPPETSSSSDSPSSTSSGKPALTCYSKARKLLPRDH